MAYQKEHKYDENDPASIEAYSKTLLEKSLRDLLPTDEVADVSRNIDEYRNNRKGYFGNLVEEKVFGFANNSDSQPDFPKAGLELKTTPLKIHKKNTYSAKERLVFSMIDYMGIVNETWATSSFIKKNKFLLILFYLYIKESILLDYKFKFVRLLDLLADIPSEDILQIKKDWEFIFQKIKRGEAHKLSEGDTFYLGACTKGANSRVLRKQPAPGAPDAKPRAYSLKQSYLNLLIQESLRRKLSLETVRKPGDEKKTIDAIIEERFRPYIGMTEEQIMSAFGIQQTSKQKNLKRSLVNRILGVKGNKIKELEKANITLKVIAIEKSGSLKESISFPIFDYCEIVKEEWEESDFYDLLTSRKFLFVVFRKQPDKSVKFEKYLFWNFPSDDLPKAEKAWKQAIEAIKANRFDNLPKMSEGNAVHVRPHAKDSTDRMMTPGGGMQIKRCFWLNAKYIKEQINA